jgi:vacuolar-type H+-ATPase subunit H
MKAKVLNPVSHNGKEYEVGSTFEGPEKLVNELIEAGALRDPATVEAEDVDTTLVEDAKAEAKTILDAANEAAAAARKDADQVVADAQKEAEKIVADAKVEAETITKTAVEAAKAKAPADNKPK